MSWALQLIIRLELSAVWTLAAVPAADDVYHSCRGPGGMRRHSGACQTPAGGGFRGLPVPRALTVIYGSCAQLRRCECGSTRRALGRQPLGAPFYSWAWPFACHRA